MARRRQCRWLIVVVLALLCVTGVLVSAEESRGDTNWICAPDDGVELNVEHLWHLQTMPASSAAFRAENEKLLALLGLPFSISLFQDGQMDRDCLIRFASFSDATGGICPPYISATARPTFAHSAAPHPSRLQFWQFYYYVFDRDALKRHFGEGRLRFLNRLRLPSEWAVVERARLHGNRTAAYGADVAEAERRLIRLGVSSPPGRVQFTFGSRLLPVSWEVSFADIKIALRAESVLSPRVLPPVMRTALCAFLTVDISGVFKRQLTLESLVSQRQYAASVESVDTSVRQVRDEQTLPALMRLIRDEADGVQFEIHQQENWKAYQHEKARQRTVLQSATPNSNTTSHTRGELIMATRETAQRAGLCEHVRRAWQTLHAEYGRTARAQSALRMDPRYQSLVSLSQHHRCPGPRVPSASRPASPLDAATEADGNSDVVPGYCAVVCDSIQQLRAWSTATSTPPTVAQLMALLTAAFVHDRAGRNGLLPSFPHDGDTISDVLDRALAVTDEFDASAFLTFAIDTFRASQCHGLPSSSTCRVPRRVEAELQYTQSMLALLRAPSSTHTSADAKDAATQPAGTLARLQEAAWRGSRRATAAIATMKEHGMWLRQQRKAAAALLMQSMSRVPSYLHIELLKARLSPPSTNTTGALRALTTQHLLRYERVFAVASSWPAIDNPFVTQETVKLMVAIEDVTSDDENEGPSADNPYDESDGANGRISTRIASMLLRALFHLTGFKDVRRSPEAAECKALAALRLLGYTCDVDVRRAVGMPLREDATCEEHHTALVALRLNQQYPRVRCMTVRLRGANATAEQAADDARYFGSGAARGGPMRPLVVPNHEVHFEQLQAALSFLSYFYLIHGQQYELAAVYAHLAFRAAANVHAATLNRLTSAERAPLANALLDMRTTTRRTPPPSNVVTALRKKLTWNELAVLDRAVASENARTEASDADRTVDLPDLARSPFLSYDHWTLLGLVSVPAGGAASSAPEAQADTQGTRDNDTIHELVRATLGLVVNRTTETTTTNAAAVVSTPTTQLLSAICLFLHGASFWRVNEKLTNVLDHTIYAVHRTDPFVLAALLVETLHGATVLDKAPSGRHTVAAALHDHIGQTSWLSRLMGDTNYLPAVDEPDATFARRLLMAARAHIRRVEASNVIFSQGLTPRPYREAVSVLNDAPLHPQLLNGLRLSKQYAMEESEFRPLLYAADLHDYLDTSAQPWHRRLMDRITNSVYYLFTETTDESMARRMGVSVLGDAAARNASHDVRTLNQSSSGGDGASRARTPAAFVALFQDCFRLFSNVRELTIALGLFTFSMEQGLPQGFAVLFLEAVDRANPFLQSVADYLATEVWTPATVRSMFAEHHAVAQWHNEKPTLRSKRGTLLSLDRRTPFGYSKAEDRQELMSRLSLWQARHVLRTAPALDGGSAPVVPSLASLVSATESLTMCASPLLHHLYVTHEHDLAAALQVAQSHSLYEGMRFPVGSPECVLAVRQLATTHHGVRDTSALIRLLKDLGERRAAYYGLSEPDMDRGDALPLSDVELGQPVAEASANQTAANTDLDNPSSPSKLVEPWNVLHDDGMRRTVDRGEGLFYNQRLHDVSGTEATARVLLWQERLRRLVPFFHW